MKLPETLSGWLGVVGVACTMIGGGYGLISSVATKDYHEKDLKPIQRSLENIEQSAGPGFGILPVASEVEPHH